MRRAWLIALCGCRSILGIDEAGPLSPPRDGTPSDSDAFVFEDAVPDGNVPGQVCFGQAKVKTCVSSQPTTDFTATSITIDTTSGSSCTLIQPQAAPPSLCVIVARNVFVPSLVSVRVVGSRPLVVVASETIIIDGVIDVASHRGSGNGAGANTGGCPTAQAGMDGVGGAGGGAGGALGAMGGGGGIGSTSAGGIATPPPSTMVLRGGCAGAKGGTSIGAGGVAGAGGGALYLLSSNSITINGTINASGAGGGAPGDRGGGGGGGAGGMIGVEAPQINIGTNARVFAVGGGGASGAGSSTAGNPGPEATGPASTSTAPPIGMSGAGGAGSALSGGNAGGNGSTTTGGGGGGGSAGIIWTFPLLPAGSAFAPPPRLP